jgi:hypothetical protein
MQLIDAVETYHDTDKGLVIESTQHLGRDFWNDLHQSKLDFKPKLDGYTLGAEVPQAVADSWLRQGFDIFTAPLSEIIARLRAENLDAFIVSGDFKF